MNNYEAIIKMDIKRLEVFLDNVYCAGLNMGMYASGLNEEEQIEALGENPFSMDWLTDEAELAVLPEAYSDDNRELPEELVKAVLTNAGIELDDE